MRLTALTLPSTRESGFAQLAFTTPKSKNRLIIDTSVLEKLKDITGFSFSAVGSNGHISVGNGLFTFNPSADTKTIYRISKNTEKNNFPANTKFIVFGTSNDNENFGSMIVAERSEGDNFTIVSTLSEIGEMINPDLLIVLNVLGEDDLNASKSTTTTPDAGSTVDKLALRKNIPTQATTSEPATRVLTDSENSIKGRALEIIIHALEVGYIKISDLDSVANGIQYMTIDEVLKIPLTNEPIRDHILRYACNDINKENEAYFFLGQNRNFVTEYNYGYLIEQAKMHPDHTISQGIGLNETLRVVLKKEESRELQEWAFSKKTKFGKALIQLFSAPLPKPTTKPTSPALPVTRSADRSPVKPSSTSTPTERITTGSSTHKPTNPPSANHSIATPHHGRIHLLERSSGEDLLKHVFSNDPAFYDSLRRSMSEEYKDNEKIVFFAQRKDVIGPRSSTERLDWAKKNPNHCFSQGLGLNERIIDDKIVKKEDRIALNKWANEDKNKETKFAKSLKILFERHPESIKISEPKVDETLINQPPLAKTLLTSTTTHQDNGHTTGHKGLKSIIERVHGEALLTCNFGTSQTLYNNIHKAMTADFANNEDMAFFGQREDVITWKSAHERLQWAKENSNHCFSQGLGLNQNLLKDNVLSRDERIALNAWANEDENKETKLAKSLKILFEKYPNSIKSERTAIDNKTEETETDSTHKILGRFTNEEVLTKEIAHGTKQYYLQRAFYPENSNNEKLIFFGQREDVLSSPNAATRYYRWAKDNPNHCFSQGLGLNENIFNDEILKPEKREELYKWANEETNKETKLGKSLISLFAKHSYSPKPIPEPIPANLPTTSHEAIPATNKSVLNIKQWREVSMNPLAFNFPNPEIISSFIKEMQSPSHANNELAMRAGMVKSLLNEGNVGEVVEWLLNNPEHKFAKGLLRNDSLCELHLDMEQAEKLLQMLEPAGV